MKKEEIAKKSQEKIQAIQVLCRQLEVEISAKQRISKDGFIENVILMLDVEKYKIDDEEPKEEQEVIKEEIKKDEKTTNL